MKILFWLSILTVIYVYLGYPLLVYVLSLFYKKPLRGKYVYPTLSILISAYNEEKLMRQKLKNCLSLDYPKEKMEIIVGSDGSTDRTNEIVKGFSSQGVTLDYEPQRLGKPSVLYRCVHKAKGEIIIFSDADSTLERDSLKKLVRNFSDPSIGCVEGVRRDINDNGILLDSLYWKYETALKKLNSRLHSLIGVTGAIFAIRRELYSPINEKRGDDLEIPTRVTLQGYKSVLEEEAVAYHPWLSNTDEFRRIIRIVSWMWKSGWILLYEAIRGGKILLIFQLLSHKILRWHIGFFLIGLFISNLFLVDGNNFYNITLIFQILFYGMAITGFIMERKGIKLKTFLKIPYYFCLINLASLIGIFKSIFNKSEITWLKTARQEI